MEFSDFWCDVKDDFIECYRYCPKETVRQFFCAVIGFYGNFSKEEREWFVKELNRWAKCLGNEIFEDNEDFIDFLSTCEELNV